MEVLSIEFYGDSVPAVLLIALAPQGCRRTKKEARALWIRLACFSCPKAVAVNRQGRVSKLYYFVTRDKYLGLDA